MARTPHFCVPVGVGGVLRHVPIEIRRTVFPPDRTALAERSFDFIDRLVRGDLRLEVLGLLRRSRTERRAAPNRRTSPARSASSSSGFAMRHSLPQTTK